MSEWIAVEDRLPEPDTTVWAYTSDGGQYAALYQPERLLSPEHWWFLGLDPAGDVTHWRPLPAPPDTEADDERN